MRGLKLSTFVLKLSVGCCKKLRRVASLEVTLDIMIGRRGFEIGE